ncbi:helix-turn-helix domain-containing protein [Corynebacterium marquesiae]|nr:helix-turn-helix domain-containing protein [Corynebacterium marquesiae]MDK8455958.1 helix-turn-helix domain-containing protein [Corynebacterium marquesiae]MDK8726072.1 helix-turn-helix domain-containing protein [Corynebacterium marquesiae]
MEERELIFDLDRQGKGVREIARHLQRSAGTISKELKRNRDEFGVYLPTHAHRKSVLRRFRPKKRKIDANPRLRTVVWAMVKDRYSPEQRVSDSLCAEAWFTSNPRIGRGTPQLVG